MSTRTGEYRSPLEGIACINTHIGDECLLSLGVVVGQDRVLAVVARADLDGASFQLRFPGDELVHPTVPILIERDGGLAWVLLDCPGAASVRAIPLDEEVQPGADCHLFTREGDEPVAVAARMSYMATVDPVQAPLMVRPAEAVVGDRLTGSPCLVNGSVVGVLSGRSQPGRPHMMSVIPSALVVDRCTKVGDRAGLLLSRTATRGRLPPPPWPRRRPAMVGWYDPGALVATAINMVISEVFGEFDDRRAMEGGVSVRYEHALVPTSPEVKELWLDYMADTGDGFDSTYAVASALSLPWLPLKHPDGTYVATRRGHVLVFGGDQVYPLATAAEYQQRFLIPFRLAATGDTPRAWDDLEMVHPWSRLPGDAPPDALPGFDPRAPWLPDKDFIGVDDDVQPIERTPPRLPWVVALPGNHDWYDNLVQFMKIFASGERFAEWNPVQSKSYFVKKLPWGWWIFGVDVQLTGDIDPDQLRYFLDWVDAMRPGDKAILCVPEPHWLDEPSRSPRKYLNVLEAALKDGGHLKLWLAGDLHHYRRHTSPEGTHKIVAGGGGAFLHATHPTKPIAILPRREKPSNDPLKPDEFRLEQSFPTPNVSRRLAFLNLLFPLLNWKFAVFLGALYLIGAWLLVPESSGAGIASGILHTYSPGEVGQALNLLTRTALVNPVAGLFLLVLIGAIRGLSNTPSSLYNWVAGLIHGVAHVICVFFTLWFVAWFTVLVLGLGVRSPSQLLVGAPLTVIFGGLLGGMMMGLYLWISSTFFGLHQNEAFSSIRNPNWKCFLRLKVTPDTLTIYPVGFRQVPRSWRTHKGRSGPVRWPWPVIPTRPFLIEKPIVLRFERPPEPVAPPPSAYSPR